MTWKLMEDLEDDALTYIMIKATEPYESGRWRRTLEGALESNMDTESADAISAIEFDYELVYSADTLDELKLLVLLEE